MSKVFGKNFGKEVERVAKQVGKEAERVGKRTEKAVQKAGNQAGERAGELSGVLATAAVKLNNASVNQALRQDRHDGEKIKDQVLAQAAEISGMVKESEESLAALTTRLDKLQEQLKDQKNIQDIPQQLQQLRDTNLVRARGAVEALKFIQDKTANFAKRDAKAARDAISNAPKESAPKNEDGSSSNAYSKDDARQLSQEALARLEQNKQEMDKAVREARVHRDNVKKEKAAIETALNAIEKTLKELMEKTPKEVKASNEAEASNGVALKGAASNGAEASNEVQMPAVGVEASKVAEAPEKAQAAAGVVAAVPLAATTIAMPAAATAEAAPEAAIAVAAPGTTATLSFEEIEKMEQQLKEKKDEIERLKDFARRQEHVRAQIRAADKEIGALRTFIGLPATSAQQPALAAAAPAAGAPFTPQANRQVSGVIVAGAASQGVSQAQAPAPAVAPATGATNGQARPA